MCALVDQYKQAGYQAAIHGREAVMPSLPNLDASIIYQLMIAFNSGYVDGEESIIEFGILDDDDYYILYQ